MLVVLSDPHFTDGTLGADDNIPARAFTYLADDLHAVFNGQARADRAERRSPGSLIVLDLCDIARQSR